MPMVYLGMGPVSANRFSLDFDASHIWSREAAENQLYFGIDLETSMKH